MEREPSENHEEKFLLKLRSRIKKYVNIAPYLVKVWIVVFLIYLVSIGAWYDVKFRKPSKILTFIEQHAKK